MKKENVSNAIGLSLPAVVFVVALILKLTHLIDWSWWWVTSPLWIMGTLLLVILIINICMVIAQVRRNNRLYKK